MKRLFIHAPPRSLPALCEGGKPEKCICADDDFLFMVVFLSVLRRQQRRPRIKNAISRENLRDDRVPFCGFTFRSREGGVAADSVAFDAARMTVDVKSLKPGEQDVKFSLVRKADMRSLGTASVKFTRFDALPNCHVYIDSY